MQSLALGSGTTDSSLDRFNYACIDGWIRKLQKNVLQRCLVHCDICNELLVIFLKRLDFGEHL